MYKKYPKFTKGLLKTLCVAVTCIGFNTACTDDYDLDDPGNYPGWLGSSIYEALKNPNQEVLTGTFTNYLRLVDDLGYAETLSRTGSKTVFVANDSAFNRFYADNTWGVTKYEDLTYAQKKMLLYGSMLDNAILVEMLSNVSYDATSVSTGVAMKHTTGLNVIDTITTIYSPDSKGIVPDNNSYWDELRANGGSLVMDGTRPMMVHFTQEQMTANSITATEDPESDFAILTGSPYNSQENTAYIFRDKVINQDVTCQNGYIQQLQDVLVPPGNLGEVIRTNGESNLFSRMVERFSVPFEDATTTLSYNNWAQANGYSTIAKIYQKRYFSSRSQGGSALTTDPNKETFKYPLSYDLGWNTYTSGENNSNALGDIAAIFVPTDDAMKSYFLPGGSGAFLIERYGKVENTEANLEQNIDSIPLSIVQAFINNLMQPSFVASVPSKFANVMDDASDPMGLTTSDLNVKNGKYDVQIANNGVAYMLNKVYAPNRYVAVSAPALLNDNMRIMNTAIDDGNNNVAPLGYGINYYAYLLAMSANYGLFIPTDDAFGDTNDWKSAGKFYVDPAYLGHTQPRALRFYYTSKSPYIACSAWNYDPATNTIGDSIGEVSNTEFRTQLEDILNYHTLVLATGETIGTNKYYKTKHGGTVMVDISGNTAKSGGQIGTLIPESKITRTYDQTNGKTYAIDHVLQAPQKSVYSIVCDATTNPQFSEFEAMCNYMYMDICMDFANDKFAQKSAVTGKQLHDSYHTFAALLGLTDNVSYFNNYNYTVFAPNNTAMEAAYAKGLPHWEDIYALYEKYEENPDLKETQQYQIDRDKALAMVEEINSFLRYHFMDNSIYADNVVSTGEYSTSCADSIGVKEKLTISQSVANTFTVKDNAGNSITINADGSTGLVNQMTRDYVFNNNAARATSIATSSFAVVHEISTPLCVHASGRYDDSYANVSAAKLARHRKLFETKLYKLY